MMRILNIAITYQYLISMFNNLNFIIISEGLPESFFRIFYVQLLMTQCMVHCVQSLYKILIFNPYVTKGVEFLPSFAFKACLV